jgi:hypothetical protein
LSEDGTLCEAGDIRFAAGDSAAPAALAQTLLDSATPPLRRLFAT